MVHWLELLLSQGVALALSKVLKATVGGETADQSEAPSLMDSSVRTVVMQMMMFQLQ